VINHFVQKLINFFPTEKIPKNKFIKFIFKLIYFLIRNILKGPFVIKTDFFKIHAYPQKQESSSIYYRGFHEYSFLKIINNLYHRDSKIIFLDIGANVGNNTLSVANFYKNICIEARNSVEERFDINIISQQLSDIYQSLLTTKKSREATIE